MASPTDPRNPGAPTRMEDTPTRVASPPQLLLDDLLRRTLVLREDWDALSAPAREGVRRQTDTEGLLGQLVEQRLLTPYQAGCIRSGRNSGLLFGNYRVLDRLGQGGMGVVLKAEHLFLRRAVALKVLPNPFEDDLQPLARFLAEVRSVAQLRHPNIVAALDAGRTQGSELEPAGWYYFAMEYVAGEDLEQHVRKGGPLPPPVACDLACQVAGALAEAHRLDLIHRDIKPSNVVRTPEGQAKLLDFGLARRLQDRRLTSPDSVAGSLEYMAPEQTVPGGAVDHRADIYGLGGTLCWCLTGQTPFPAGVTSAEELILRRTQTPPSIREQRPDLPAELDAVVARMMALRPEDRYPTAQAVVGALLPFLSPAVGSGQWPAVREDRTTSLTAGPSALTTARKRVLIADDDRVSRLLCRHVLGREGFACDEADDGERALESARSGGYDLVLLDIHMPGLTGPEVLRRLREQPPSPNLKVVMLSGEVGTDEMAELLAAGADDYLSKPPGAAELIARVRAALSLKEAQDRSDLLNRNLLAVNAELERSLRASAGDLTQSRNALLLALAELAEQRAGQAGAHLLRIQRYCRLLATEAAALPAFAGQIDDHFVAMLECCAPLHDIGLAALPDHVLRKAGKFDHEERLLMQSHTTLGADILQGIARRHCSALAVLQTAADIARHHHEAFDGRGYPDRLAGTAIPLSARLVAVADAYDALRSRRPHRPAFPHLFALELMTEGSPGRFDPHLLGAFERCAAQFDRIVRDLPDPASG